jgi:outer membrane protein OmpA-like peptidoglycan-associated protein
MGWLAKYLGISGAVLAAAVSVGCQNKLYDQNKELMDENKALRDQNDAMRQKPAPTPQPPVIPAQPVVVPTTPAQPINTPIAPPLNVEQIGGLETTVSPRTGNTTVHLPSDVFFDPGQATLKSAAKASLDKVITALNKGKYADKGIRVEGHTDSTPIRVSKWASNQELSDARAQAVQAYLVSRGVPASRITTKGFGDTKPRSTTDISKTRRVELVVLTGQ